MKKAVILGGGASGMAAAVFLSDAGIPVTLYEKNEKLGKKLFITGKGRCNFTNACSPVEFLENVVSNRKFLYSSIYGFTPSDSIAFFEGLGLSVKVERGRRAFPSSDHSSDVIKAMEKRMRKNGVKICLNTKVDSLSELKRLSGADEETAVIIACGGLSYPSTGSDGDGYSIAEELGMKVNPKRPALVPLLTGEDYIPLLQGLSLKNVTLTVKKGKKELYNAFGEMLFTHFGVSGPLVLSASSIIAKALDDGSLSAFIDLKPALDHEALEARVLREFEMYKNKRFKNSLSALLPAKLIPVIISVSGIDPELPVNKITKNMREEFVRLLKGFPFTITGSRPFEEAIITQGGVSVKDINPKTMESRSADNVYFIGEELDVDALTGGYNLQIAWSTAYAAARAVIEKDKEVE